MFQKELRKLIPFILSLELQKSPVMLNKITKCVINFCILGSKTKSFEIKTISRPIEINQIYDKYIFYSQCNSVIFEI